MADKKEIENALKNIPNGVEPNKDLVNDAENLTQELYIRNRVRKPSKKIWGIVAAISMCFVGALIGIIVPILNYAPTVDAPIVNYFTDSELIRENLSDVSNFALPNNERFEYLSDAQQTYLYRIKETNQPVIIQQDYLYFDENNYDQVKLEICLTNDSFNRYERYQDLTEQKNINDIAVRYSVKQEDDLYVISVKCQVKSFYYYLDISSLQGEERIDYYINMLFA